MPARDAQTPGALTLVRFRGVPIRAHWTLLLALPFFAWVMTTQYFGITPEGWTWGFALAITLFASVTVHEVAHSLVALRRGVEIREIILLPIGGASIMTTPSHDPKTEFLIAGVGPLVSLILGAGLLGAAIVLGIPLTTPASVPPAEGFVLAAGYLNVSLGLFNLLVPAFPMDGGRLLRAFLAHRLGLDHATRIAASVGRGLAVLMGIGGLLGGNLLLLVIAVFVWSGASTEEQAVRVTTTLEGVQLGDVMTREPATVSPTASLDDALGIMLETKHVVLPVVAHDRPIGILSSDDIAAVPPAVRRTMTVADLPPRDVPKRSADDPAANALPTIVESGIIAIVDASDRLLGVVTPTDIIRTVQLLGAAKRPPMTG